MGARKNFELRVGKISNAKVAFVSNPYRGKSFEYKSVSDLFRISNLIHFLSQLQGEYLLKFNDFNHIAPLLYLTFHF